MAEFVRDQFHKAELLAVREHTNLPGIKFVDAAAHILILRIARVLFNKNSVAIPEATQPTTGFADYPLSEARTRNFPFRG
ncbi:MAG: hypothetical protein IT450_03225 [Phycisphaerales bacterium]|nr:hypothetical protein [Phycisphaerales bacterium]